LTIEVERLSGEVIRLELTGGATVSSVSFSAVARATSKRSNGSRWSQSKVATRIR